MKNPLLHKKRIRRITSFFNSGAGLRFIPYGLGVKYISWFCSTRFAQRKYFNKKLPIIEEFLQHFPGKYNRTEAVSNFFALNYLHGWRASSISRMRGFNLKRRLKTKGLDEFRDAFALGKGVILLGSHFGLPAATFSLMPRLGYKNFYTIIGEKGAESVKFKGVKDAWKPKLLVFKRGGESDAFSMLFEAKELLEQGNILHLLGDGAHGRASHNLPFLGKMRGYRATFAELAILTGSPVVPVFVIPRKGKFVLEFLPALNQGTDEQDREERVLQIVKQYSELLEERWRNEPAMINGGFMEMFNRQIQADDSLLN
ncbi:MAG TPA: hypothetical protein VK994_01015 [Bacteroidales bacterium]|nr:hypothetical protein [Bacteroidales bacterium]